MKKLPLVIAWVASLCLAYHAGSKTRSHEPDTVVIHRVDTVRVLCPEVTAIYVRGEVKERLPLAIDSVIGDSADVRVPISQAVYSGADYTAYISGFRPALDSLVMTQVSYMEVPRPSRQSRWSVGIQAGYGITPRGFQPFLGIGVSFRIF